MHLVTSSLFLLSITAYLTPQSSIVLLQAYFATTLIWWISQGCTALPICDFYVATTTNLTPPTTGTATIATKGTPMLEDITLNAWLPIVQTTLTHPDQHISKLQHALLHSATEYGACEARYLASMDLEGSNTLDGTLFICIVGLSADRLGWMKKGQAEGAWDRGGFY